MRECKYLGELKPGEFVYAVNFNGGQVKRGTVTEVYSYIEADFDDGCWFIPNNGGLSTDGEWFFTADREWFEKHMSYLAREMAAL